MRPRVLLLGSGLHAQHIATALQNAGYMVVMDQPVVSLEPSTYDMKDVIEACKAKDEPIPVAALDTPHRPYGKKYRRHNK